MSIYTDLTESFNKGRLRAILSSGQAVVLHGLAVMSKDGDWIVREDDEALTAILAELDRRGAKYRFGAPLDLRWMRGGWSSHFEFNYGGLRVRTDFVTRPARIGPERLARYEAAAEEWSRIWPHVERECVGLRLSQAHEIVASRAEKVLPYAPTGESPNA